MNTTGIELSGTVLCIEDEPVCMALVEAILAEHPAVRLVKATGGREGLQLALSDVPDLVLLDMNLPDMSGLQVVRELSELIAQHALRVVLLTSDSFSIDVVKALSLGAQEYWHKPLTSERLTIGLSRALEAVRRPAT